MDAQLHPLTADTIALVHYQCARSVLWEMSPEARAVPNLDAAFEKEAWLATALFDGVCHGFNLMYNRPDVSPIRAIATVLACSPDYAPGAVVMPSAPVSDDAELVTSLHIDPVIADTGLETVLLDAVVMEMVRQHKTAVEVFGLRRDFVADPEVPVAPEVAAVMATTEQMGLVGVDILESAGFRVVADHPVLPRLRMELPPTRELISEQAAAELLSRIYA